MRGPNGGGGGGGPILDKAELVAALQCGVERGGRLRPGARRDAGDHCRRRRALQRIGLIDDAVEAFLATEADKKHFLQLASRVARLFKAILPDPLANELAPLAVLVSYLAAKIHAETDPPDISAVMSDVEELLNDSIATEGYRIGPPSKPEALVNLSEIDFEALQAKFAQGHKRTEAEKLKRLIEGKLAQMLSVNSSRIDLAEKFREKLVLDWREKQQAKAAVMQTLKLEMRRLPPRYTKDIRAEKMARAYAYVYDHYHGAGRSAYVSAHAG